MWSSILHIYYLCVMAFNIFFTWCNIRSLGIIRYGCSNVQQVQLNSRHGDALCKMKTNSCVCIPDERL